jgi:large subunit ribosomal protein L9
MEVILTQDMHKLGKAGSVVKVKSGFARNFLLPRNLAVAATPGNLKKIEQAAKRLAGMRQREKEKAEGLAERLKGISITLPAATHDEDKLHGSITAADIVEALRQEGITEVAKEAVILDEPIKSLGVYNMNIRLHPEVFAEIKVWVVKK